MFQQPDRRIPFGSAVTDILWATPVKIRIHLHTDNAHIRRDPEPVIRLVTVSASTYLVVPRSIEPALANGQEGLRPLVQEVTAVRRAGRANHMILRKQHQTVVGSSQIESPVSFVANDPLASAGIIR